MHLIFSDTSPLKVFAFCLRCLQLVSFVNKPTRLVNLSAFKNLGAMSQGLVPFVNDLFTNATESITGVKQGKPVR